MLLGTRPNRRRHLLYTTSPGGWGPILPRIPHGRGEQNAVTYVPLTLTAVLFLLLLRLSPADVHTGLRSVKTPLVRWSPGQPRRFPTVAGWRKVLSGVAGRLRMFLQVEFYEFIEIPLKFSWIFISSTAGGRNLEIKKNQGEKVSYYVTKNIMS